MKKQQSFTDLEYSMRKRKTKRDEFLETMDAITPWEEIVAMIEPYLPPPFQVSLLPDVTVERRDPRPQGSPMINITKFL